MESTKKVGSMSDTINSLWQTLRYEENTAPEVFESHLRSLLENYSPDIIKDRNSDYTLDYFIFSIQKSCSKEHHWCSKKEAQQYLTFTNVVESKKQDFSEKDEIYIKQLLSNIKYEMHK